MIKNVGLLILIGIGLAACGSSSKDSPAPTTLTDNQHKLFQQSCQTCHTNPATPAPQTGDHAAWQTRLDKGGMPLLVQHAMQGFNAMPAGGFCTTCTPADMEAMIHYMATTKPH